MSAALVFPARSLREFLSCDTRLQGMLIWLASQWPANAMLVGDIHRSLEEEKAAGGKSGIHIEGPPYRAIDVRVSNLDGDGWAEAEKLGNLVNAKYEYDPTRPTKLCAYTAKHGTGAHIHLQVHPATRLRLSAVEA